MLSESRMWGTIPSGFKKVANNAGLRLVVREDRVDHIGFAICRFDQEGAGVQRYHGRGALRAVPLGREARQKLAVPETSMP